MWFKLHLVYIQRPFFEKGCAWQYIQPSGWHSFEVDSIPRGRSNQYRGGRNKWGKNDQEPQKLICLPHSVRKTRLTALDPFVRRIVGKVGSTAGKNISGWRTLLSNVLKHTRCVIPTQLLPQEKFESKHLTASMVMSRHCKRWIGLPTIWNCDGNLVMGHIGTPTPPNAAN